MSISSRLSSYLEQHGTRYDVVAHEPSRSSVQTARAAQVSPHQIAKSVIVEDDIGCIMAVIPADKAVRLGHLSQLLGRKQLRLADEGRLARLFDDCEFGAVPPVGMAWGMETIVDDELEANEVVYLEGGDHERLLRMSHEQFHALMRAAQHGNFCKKLLH